MVGLNARVLRANSTEAEKLFWGRVKSGQINGHKFRRQVPIGDYVVDFLCVKQKLIVELDGGQHAVQTEKDGIRSDWLISQGFRILRFWNNEVMENLEGVLDEVQKHLD